MPGLRNELHNSSFSLFLSILHFSAVGSHPGYSLIWGSLRSLSCTQAQRQFLPPGIKYRLGNPSQSLSIPPLKKKKQNNNITRRAWHYVSIKYTACKFYKWNNNITRKACYSYRMCMQSSLMVCARAWHYISIKYTACKFYKWNNL